MEIVAEESELETIEIDLFLEGIYRRYGYDFRDYARASLRRRIREFMSREGIENVSALLEKALHEPSCFERFLLALTVNVTAIFRDPEFWLVLRSKALPLLRELPFFRVWCVGCSTGEEVYSTAILLQEENLYDRCRIYATDINEAVLQRASDGVFPLAVETDYAENYRKAGGIRNLTDYYTAAYGNAMFSQSLKKNIVFAQHNLVTDASFNEFHIVLCRNVMIYFNKSLQNHVHNLLYDSLAVHGLLGLGNAESIRFTPRENYYEQVDMKEKLYRRMA